MCWPVKHTLCIKGEDNLFWARTNTGKGNGISSFHRGPQVALHDKWQNFTWTAMHCKTKNRKIRFSSIPWSCTMSPYWSNITRNANVPVIVGILSSFSRWVTYSKYHIAFYDHFQLTWGWKFNSGTREVVNKKGWLPPLFIEKLPQVNWWENGNWLWGTVEGGGGSPVFRSPREQCWTAKTIFWIISVYLGVLKRDGLCLILRSM